MSWKTVSHIQKNEVKQIKQINTKKTNLIEHDNLDLEDEEIMDDKEEYLTEMDDLTDFITSVKEGRLWKW